ncbi:MAG TPA: ATPase, partial [Woeseiaceae bacterium]
MASAEQLKALLKSHIEGDGGRFLSIAMQVAAHEAKLGHGKLAEELRDMIDAAKSHSRSTATGKLVPLAKPRGELAGLLSVSYPQTRISDMVLNNDVSQKLGRTIKEQRFFAKLQEHGLSPRRK